MSAPDPRQQCAEHGHIWVDVVSGMARCSRCQTEVFDLVDDQPPLPSLAVGTFTYRDVVFLRADQLHAWIQDAAVSPRYGGDETAVTLLGELADMIADAGGLPRG